MTCFIRRLQQHHFEVGCNDRGERLRHGSFRQVSQYSPVSETSSVDPFDRWVSGSKNSMASWPVRLTNIIGASMREPIRSLGGLTSSGPLQKAVYATRQPSVAVGLGLAAALGLLLLRSRSSRTSVQFPDGFAAKKSLRLRAAWGKSPATC